MGPRLRELAPPHGQREPGGGTHANYGPPFSRSLYITDLCMLNSRRAIQCLTVTVHTECIKVSASTGNNYHTMALSNKNAEERPNGTPGNVGPKEEPAVSDNSETPKQEEDSKHVDNFGQMFVEELRSDPQNVQDVKEEGPARAKKIRRVGGNICCVVNCRSNSRKDRPTLKFFCIPAASRNAEQRELWLKAINRAEVDGSPWIPKPSAIVCSRQSCMRSLI